MPHETTLSRWCGRIIEACWVLALTLVPIYFNLFSARHFEPDKAMVLRTLVVIAATLGLIRGLEALRHDPPRLDAGWWQRLRAIPLALPTLVYALVFLITTATSVIPATSFWGSYQRLQGTYTNLSYLLLGLLMVVTIRSRAQIERIISISLIAGVTTATYGVIQHFQLDPLPWKGDVITRVASTLGNSIFVAAYLIMIVPLAIYRMVVRWSTARSAPPSPDPRTDGLRALAHGLLILSGMLLLFAVIKFGAAVRTVDFRYWWFLPAAVMSATSLWWLITLGPEHRFPRWPAVATLTLLLLFSGQFAFTAANGIQVAVSADEAPHAYDWAAWLLASIVSGGLGYGLGSWLPRSLAQPSRLSLRITALASGAAALLMVITIVLSQSRGPFLGLAASLFLFCSLLLWAALRHARSQQQPRLAARLRTLLIGWVGVAVLAAAFLITFNLSDATFFNQLRSVPYLGRMGRLLEIESGTGLVRRLIWTGDAHGGGAVGMIVADPWHALVGWGPESMFVAFNPFFPPSLANVEARGASPDRSHMAYLDELVTKGVIGLASYLFLISSFIALALRLIWRSPSWPQQVFFITMLSMVAAHLVEGGFGIPIVATLMMLWVAVAITVVGGALDGHYALSLAPPAPPTSEPEAQRRGSAKGRNKPPLRAQRVGQTPALLVYAALILLALWFTWSANLAPVYADMRYQAAQGVSEQAGSDLNRLVVALDDYLATLRSNPNEDFYYLGLAHNLMTITSVLHARGVPLGAADPQANVPDLLRLDSDDTLVAFLQRSTSLEMLSYAEAVLQRAYQLNPLNKDHAANLGRLNSYWYNLSNDPQRLDQGLKWYDQVAHLAPNDVTLINERAGAMIDLGRFFQRSGEQSQAEVWYTQAEELLNHSTELDPRYADTALRLGDLAQLRGDRATATSFYERGIELSPLTAAQNVERLAERLNNEPALLSRLHTAFLTAAQRYDERLERSTDDATLRSQTARLYAVAGLLAAYADASEEALAPYQRAVNLQPTSVEYSQNYTLILSDTQRYQEALAEANRMLIVVQGSGRSSEIANVEQLIEEIMRMQNH
ncbi:tetratricopeptide repeat protein [Candidatus Oscillochloris fontis]|uniref:tetratricopeptide repeat protein n=1 Tax=Candidatus Oscillochloris fontis TaxID=2496868 RepID=UPI00101B83DC|nr:tetratricopeptide repeat protein [Candidatus Oscillochloris fontis]